MYLGILHVGAKSNNRRTNTVQELALPSLDTNDDPAVFGTASRPSDRNEEKTNESDEINNEGKGKSRSAT